MSTTILILLCVVVVVAILFDFLNGFHDAANAIATPVVTKALTPGQAIMLAGAANFVGYFFFELHVADTVSKTVSLNNFSSSEIKLVVILSALTGAALWNVLTWLLGLPTSSSHALIGGLIGSGVTAGIHHLAFGAPQWAAASTGGKWGLVWDAVCQSAHWSVHGGVAGTVLGIFVAPMVGMVLASILSIIIMNICRKARPTTVTNVFRRLQIFSCTLYSVGHGLNDAQKTMGVIFLALFAANLYVPADGKLATLLKHPPQWPVFACYAAIGCGTMFGGWRIVKTMGTRITKIRPFEGFIAEISGSTVLLLNGIIKSLGIPISTTHVIAGSIMGVGAIEHAAKVRWVTARNILWAWIFTIPLTALCSSLTYLVIQIFL